MQKRQVRKLIAGSLQEEHRDVHFDEVLAPLGRRLTRGMKREAEECEAADPRQWRFGMRLRSHTATKGFAAGEQRKSRKQTCGFNHRGAHGRLSQFRGIWPL